MARDSECLGRGRGGGGGGGGGGGHLIAELAARLHARLRVAAISSSASAFAAVATSAEVFDRSIVPADRLSVLLASERFVALLLGLGGAQPGRFLRASAAREQPYQLVVAHALRKREWRVSIRVGSRRVGAKGKQLAHAVGMATEDGGPERRRIALVARMRVRACLKQQPQRACVALGGAPMDGRVPDDGVSRASAAVVEEGAAIGVVGEGGPQRVLIARLRRLHEGTQRAGWWHRRPPHRSAAAGLGTVLCLLIFALPWYHCTQLVTPQVV